MTHKRLITVYVFFGVLLLVSLFFHSNGNAVGNRSVSESSNYSVGDRPYSTDEVEGISEGEGPLVNRVDEVVFEEKRLEGIVEKFERVTPKEWGERVSGVQNRLDTDEKKIALTLDACGGGYDKEILKYLIEEEIPATIFASGKWLDIFPEVARDLSQMDIFTIENHGWEHKPCSVSGEYAFGVRGTESVKEVVEEIEKNNLMIEKITGRSPSFYRSGTAHYDEVCIGIAKEMGLKVAGFSVAGDAGASFNRYQIEEEMSRASPGSIILLHMNRPESEVAEGIKKGVESLRERGYEFVDLSGHLPVE